MNGESMIAVDLGASSGRVMLGRIEAGVLELEEVHRFTNDPVELPDGLHWDVLRLYHEVLTGVREAARRAPDVSSIGIDSWAIDYGLLDAQGALLYQPFHYRDGRTAGVIDAVHGQISQQSLYARTGLQYLPFNTIYQLAAARLAPAFASVERVLLIPDLLGFWLTGEVMAERTNASTTGLFDATSRSWAPEICRAIGVRPSLLPPLIDAGSQLGSVREAVRDTTALRHDMQVICVGSHDTASAVVGVPAATRRFGYIACGTWSLVGVELDAPILSDESRAANFTNEAGVDGRIRYLRNVAGLWLLQETLRTWERDGTPEELVALLDAAARLPVGGPVFDPDDPLFLPPGDMPVRIITACRATGVAPEGRPALVRCILDSLAAAYARALADAVRLSGSAVDVVHLVGGGAHNTLLCQLTADACGLPVVAGPAEATALGNVLVQARTQGLIDGDLEALRAVSRVSSTLHTFEPGLGRKALA